MDKTKSKQQRLAAWISLYGALIWFHLDFDIFWAVSIDILYRSPHLLCLLDVSQNLSKSYLWTFIRNGHRKCLIPERLVEVPHTRQHTHRLGNTEINQMK